MNPRGRDGLGVTLAAALAAAAIGGLAAYNPLYAAAAVLVFATVLFARTSLHVMYVMIVSEMLLTGIGKLHTVSVGSVTMNGSVVVDLLALTLGLAVMVARREKLLFKEMAGFYALVVVAAVSYLVSVSPADTVKGVVKLIELCVIYAVCRAAAKEGPVAVDGVTRFWSANAIIVSVLAAVEWVLGKSIIGASQVVQNAYATDSDAVTQFRRAASTFSHPNQLAVSMGAVAFFLLGCALVRREPIAWVAAPISAVAVLLSFSRVGWAGLLAAGILVLPLFVPKGRRTTFAILAIAGTVGVVALAGPLVASRLTIDSSALLRLSLVQKELGLASASGILGIGYNGWVSVSSDLFGYTVMAHGDYVRLIVETGFAGFVAFVFWLASTGVRMARSASRVDPVRYRPLVLAGAAIVLIYAIFALTDNAIDGMGVLVMTLGFIDGLVATRALDVPAEGAKAA